MRPCIIINMNEMKKCFKLRKKNKKQGGGEWVKMTGYSIFMGSNVLT